MKTCWQENLALSFTEVSLHVLIFLGYTMQLLVHCYNASNSVQVLHSEGPCSMVVLSKYVVACPLVWYSNWHTHNIGLQISIELLLTQPVYTRLKHSNRISASHNNAELSHVRVGLSTCMTVTCP